MIQGQLLERVGGLALEALVLWQEVLLGHIVLEQFLIDGIDDDGRQGLDLIRDGLDGIDIVLA